MGLDPIGPEMNPFSSISSTILRHVHIRFEVSVEFLNVDIWPRSNAISIAFGKSSSSYSPSPNCGKWIVPWFDQFVHFVIIIWRCVLVFTKLRLFRLLYRWHRRTARESVCLSPTGNTAYPRVRAIFRRRPYQGWCASQPGLLPQTKYGTDVCFN